MRTYVYNLAKALPLEDSTVALQPSHSGGAMCEEGRIVERSTEVLDIEIIRETLFSKA